MEIYEATQVNMAKMCTKFNPYIMIKLKMCSDPFSSPSDGLMQYAAHNKRLVTTIRR